MTNFKKIFSLLTSGYATVWLLAILAYEVYGGEDAILLVVISGLFTIGFVWQLGDVVRSIHKSIKERRLRKKHEKALIEKENLKRELRAI